MLLSSTDGRKQINGMQPAPLPAPKHYTAIECPCCKKPIGVPSLSVVIDHYQITKMQAAILSAVWRGKGYPVPTERIFDLMFEDDPDGGPSPPRMRAAFKMALFRLRTRLNGSGVSVETVGYRRGFRLVLKDRGEHGPRP